jgi:hypothetical protein
MERPSGPPDTRRSSSFLATRRSPGRSIITLAQRSSAIRRVWLFALLTTVLGASAGEAMAAVWSQPSLVARARRPVRVVATVAAASDAVVVWEEYDIVGTGRQQVSQNFAVSAASGPLGQKLGAPRQLDRTREDPAPALAVSATGYSALAWNQDGRAVAVAVRAPGGGFGAPITIPAQSTTSGPVRVGVDDAGTVTVLWSEWAGLGTQATVRYAVVLSDGTLVPARTLATDVSIGGWVFLAVGSAGDVVAAWSTYGTGAAQGREAQVALRPHGGEFGSPTAFADPTADASPSGLSMEPSGRATVLLRRWRPPTPPPAASDPGTVMLVQGTAGEGWAAPQSFDPNADVRTYQLAANARGDRVALWDTQPTYWPYQPGAARVSLAPAGQPFADPVVEPAPALLGPSEGSAFLDLPTAASITSDGEALVLWEGPLLGMQVHPVSPSGQAEPLEPILQDACHGATGVLSAGGPPGVAVAAWQAIHSPPGADHEVWAAYRNAGPPPRPLSPRICSVLWEPRVPGIGATVPSGRVHLYLRLSKPVAHVSVTVRTAPSGRRRHGRVLSRQRLGARPTGYVGLTLRGRHGSWRLAPGRYRVSATAVDTSGRRSPRVTTTVRVLRRSR